MTGFFYRKNNSYNRIMTGITEKISVIIENLPEILENWPVTLEKYQLW